MIGSMGVICRAVDLRIGVWNFTGAGLGFLWVFWHARTCLLIGEDTSDHHPGQVFLLHHQFVFLDLCLLEGSFLWYFWGALVGHFSWSWICFGSRG